MKGHKVVTVERNGGYAARCEVERDGVTHLCDITFGGFATRTEAREAIVHEETPGAVGAAAGGLTPKEGNQMSTPNCSTLAQAVQDVMHALSTDAMVHLSERSILFQHEGWHTVPKSIMPGLTAEDVRHRVWTAAYDRNGVRRHYLDREFWVEAMLTANRDQMDVLTGRRENVAVMMGDLLVVGWGKRVLIEETDEAFILASGLRAERVLDERFLAEHAPAVDAARPAWMLDGEQPIVLRGSGGGSFMFERHFGRVTLTTSLELTEGEYITEETVILLPPESELTEVSVREMFADVEAASMAAGWNAEGASGD